MHPYRFLTGTVCHAIISSTKISVDKSHDGLKIFSIDASSSSLAMILVDTVIIVHRWFSLPTIWIDVTTAFPYFFLLHFLHLLPLLFLFYITCLPFLLSSLDLTLLLRAALNFSILSRFACRVRCGGTDLFGSWAVYIQAYKLSRNDHLLWHKL